MGAVAGYGALNLVGAATPWKFPLTRPVVRFKGGLKVSGQGYSVLGGRRIAAIVTSHDTTSNKSNTEEWEHVMGPGMP